MKISRKESATTVMYRISLTAIIFLILSMVSPAFANEQPVIESTGQQEYSVPEEKKKDWENISNQVLDEYKICQEHCGNDLDCMNRCERVYKHRLEMEHKKLMYE